jgi:hypothetical protein
MKIEYRFSSKLWQYPGLGGWHFISLPLKLSNEIRRSFKSAEAGWGRLTVAARIGATEWRAAIWFDTKRNTYLLPLKAEVRKRENLVAGKSVKAAVII